MRPSPTIGVGVIGLFAAFSGAADGVRLLDAETRSHITDACNGKPCLTTASRP
jgi:hypothetical protein